MQEIFAKIRERLEEMSQWNKKYGDTEGYSYTAYDTAIEIVNDVEAECGNDGWIPCSVGLPKAHIEVWITYKWGDGSIHVGRDRVIHGEWYCTKREAAIAWKYMKVPAPYQPKGE